MRRANRARAGCARCRRSRSRACLRRAAAPARGPSRVGGGAAPRRDCTESCVTGMSASGYIHLQRHPRAVVEAALGVDARTAIPRAPSSDCTRGARAPARRAPDSAIVVELARRSRRSRGSSRAARAATPRARSCPSAPRPSGSPWPRQLAPELRPGARERVRPRPRASARRAKGRARAGPVNRRPRRGRAVRSRTRGSRARAMKNAPVRRIARRWLPPVTQVTDAVGERARGSRRGAWPRPRGRRTRRRDPAARSTRPARGPPTGSSPCTAPRGWPRPRTCAVRGREVRDDRHRDPAHDRDAQRHHLADAVLRVAEARTRRSPRSRSPPGSA